MVFRRKNNIPHLTQGERIDIYDHLLISPFVPYYDFPFTKNRKIKLKRNGKETVCEVFHLVKLDMIGYESDLCANSKKLKKETQKKKKGMHIFIKKSRSENKFF